MLDIGMTDSERLNIIEHNFHDVYSDSNIHKIILKGTLTPDPLVPTPVLHS